MLNSKEKTKKHFDEVASDYNRSEDGIFVSPMYEKLVESLNYIGSGKLLDIGCGNGNLFGLLKKGHFEFHGIDFSEPMIQAAKETYADVAELKVADAEALPYENEKFDVLVCNASFHHYIHPDVVMGEMSRVTKEGGQLLIGDPYSPQPLRCLMNIFVKYSDGGDYHFYGEKEMKKLMRKHGFEMKKVIRTSYRSILYTAVKVEAC